MEIEERINDLQSRLAFQDDTIQALNDALVAQQRLLERLQLQVAALIKRQDEVSSQFSVAEDEAPPPHY
ncbi:MAG: SlyX family protein [Gammaproteobacteria bacterium]|nr:SlyX family protein [Gammaproteobacteria bacterium]MBU2156284.1 SlyX family protein [Gammaproteobacteria bacterium]MBU2253427.1 SlyX family protein [Gammaproteobacteria bacterium]MBU2295024.1 SlyX family protein [Gammaproteobacteria bacterium]